MIIITISNYSIVLSKEEAVRITLGNAVMTEESSYTLPIEINLKGFVNRAAIKFMNDMKVCGFREQALVASIIVDGVSFFSGYAYISTIEDDYASLILKGNVYEFWDYIEDIHLSDLEWPTIANAPSRTDIDAILSFLNASLSGTKDYIAFPMANVQDLENADDLDNDNACTITGLYNYYDIENGEFINSSKDWGEKSVAGFYPYKYKYHNTVFLRLYVVLNNIFKALGYIVEYNMFAQADYTEIVILNTFKIRNSYQGVTFENLLPEMTVSDFLDSFRQAGVIFDIDFLSKKVSITCADDKINTLPSTTISPLRKGRKIKPNDQDEFQISMGSSGVYNGDSSNSPFNYFKIVKQTSAKGYDIEGGNSCESSIATVKDIVSRSIGEGNVYYARNEGTFYVCNASGDYERKGGNFGKITSLAVNDRSDDIWDYDEDKDIDVSINTGLSVALSQAQTYLDIGGVVGDAKGLLTTIDIDPDNFTDIILQVFRGMQYIYGDSIETSLSYSYPVANHVPYDIRGNAVNGLTLDTSFFYDLAWSKIELLMKSYTLEYKFVGKLSDLLSTVFDPVLIEGQKAIIKQRSAKLLNEDITITDTVYVEQQSE